MSTLPASGYLSNAARTVGEQKQALEDLLAGIKQIPGAGVAESTLTIASGAITPPAGSGGCFAVDTEAAAATDDLQTIVQTNVPDGSLLLLHPANAARAINVKHAAGGAGQISARDGVDFTLADVAQHVLLRRSGTSWLEVDRMPSAARRVRSVSGTANALLTDEVLVLSGASFTLTLPTPVGHTGKGFEIRHAGAHFTQIYTIATAAGQIDGTSTFLLHTTRERLLVISDGTNWILLQHDAMTEWINGGALTIEAVTANPTKATTRQHDQLWYRRVGEDIQAVYRYAASSNAGAAAGTGDYLFALPWAADTTVEPTSTAGITPLSPLVVAQMRGRAQGRLDATPWHGWLPLLYSASRFRVFYYDTASPQFVSASAYALTNAGFSFWIWIEYKGADLRR